MEPTKIGDYLFQLRKQKNLTQKDIATLCSVSTQAVSKWERGESIPDIELLERLSILYEISINDIINGEVQLKQTDKKRNSNVISLILSIFVFISLFFTFLEFRTYQGSTSYSYVILKGYEVIFDGLSGLTVYVSWMIFLMLITQLLLYIFLSTNLITRNGLINLTLMGSTVALIISSIICIAIDVFFNLPQILILIIQLGHVFTYIWSLDETSLWYKLREYRNYKKNGDVPNELMLSTEHLETVLYKVSFFFVYVGVALVGITILFLIGVVIDGIRYDYQSGLAPLILLIVHMTLFIYLLHSSTYMGSIYTKEILLINAVVLFYVLFSMYFFTGINAIGIFVLPITIFGPIVLTIQSLKLKRVRQ